MKRFAALALAATPLTVALCLPVAPAAAQADALAQVSTHLKAVNTMVADFSQTGQNGQTLSGTLSLKRPGKIRFQYQKGVPLLIVGDGRALTMIDYQVKQVSRWPIGDSPLAVLLNPDKNLASVAKVVEDTPQIVVISAKDRKHPEFGTITIAFTKSSAGPGGLVMRGWTTLDGQNNRTTVRLSNQRFNVAVPDSTFRWKDPRGVGPRG